MSTASAVAGRSPASEMTPLIVPAQSGEVPSSVANSRLEGLNRRFST
jgi:hypothetical protein